MLCSYVDWVRHDRLAALLDRSGLTREAPDGDIRRNVGALELVHRIITAVPGTRQPFWRTFVNCAQTNPAALRFIISLMAMYLHLGPLSRHVVAVLDRRIAALDAQMPERPVAHDKTSVAAVM